MKRRKSINIAFCGITGALILLLMLLGNIIPVATYAVPCLACILMMAAMEECGTKSAWTLYCGVTLLSLIIITDKELALLYVLFMGFYPMLKAAIEKLPSKALRYILKLASFNTALCAVYALLLIVFPLEELAAEFAELGTYMTIALIILGNVTFLLLDKLLEKFKILYIKKLRPKLIRSSRS